MYVMVAQWDSYQLTRLIADDYRSVSLPPKREKEKNYLSQFGNFTYRSISRVRYKNLVALPLIMYLIRKFIH